LGRQARTEREATAVAAARRAPIQRAIDRGEVRIVFQPVARLSDGATLGYEALARLGEHGDAPAPWFRLARELGLGTDLELTCLAAIAEVGLPPGDALLFVNVSPTTLVHPRMHELCGPLADRLVVELTEHTEVADYAALRPSVERWSSRGVRLAVDDTGAGYASLRHVLELAPHFLKLDGTVVGGLDQHAARRALVAALVTFADDVGTTVIAEGVERWSEAEALRDVGVHLAQGFAFGRPQQRWSPAQWPPTAGRRSGRAPLRAVPEPPDG
jgi:EAL domain-containing protein (putative c-di-GMP-specific phosphodiesterase class I)